MGVILDSSVLIEAERGRVDLVAHLNSLGDEAVAISAVTASELLHGVHRARTPTQRTKRHDFVEAILREVPTADFGLPQARVHAELWARLLARGKPIGAHDLIIAATALSLGFRLATANPRELRRIPGLVLEDWTTPPA